VEHHAGKEADPPADDEGAGHLVEYPVAHLPGHGAGSGEVRVQVKHRDEDGDEDDQDNPGRSG
jgi:hypothetical protein